MRPILVTHIMKTGGTSLRRMLVDAVGPDRVYPNDEDLADRPHGWYPGSREFVDILRSGGAHGADILIGHFPFVLREEFEFDPLTVALLRDPLDRTLSMLRHRKLKRRRSDLSYEQLLYQHDFVERQVRDYQTKIFAFDSIQQCPETVDIALDVDEERFKSAVDRLSTVDVLGLTEDFGGFCARFTEITGVALHPRRDNKSPIRETLEPHEVLQIKALTRYDQRLHESAAGLIHSGNRRNVEKGD